jgi:methionyl-tRNA synthetase
MNEARAFVEGGLDDISISRSSITWGVPLPWQPDQVLYVWIDALLNYASALTYARADDDLARFWPPRRQVLAKDILKFHAVIWPALLMAAGREVPQQLVIHGYLTVRDSKMSKTTGNVLDPAAIIARYGVDALRYYVLREVRFGGDGDVSYAGVHERYHGELANELGNLVSRTAAMVARYRAGRVPEGSGDPAVAAAVDLAARRFAAHVDGFELTEALDAVWVPVRDLNRFVEERAPWKLAKDPARSGELDDVLFTLVDGIRAVAVMLASVTPSSAGRILRVVGAPEDTGWGRARAGLSTAGAAVAADGPLFPRVDEPLPA